MGAPSWAEIINGAVAGGMDALSVAIPGNVVSYSNGYADVRPGLRRLVPALEEDGLDVPEELPIIPSVPVMFPRGRNFQVDGTLSPGDPVLLVCCDYDISTWLATGALADPEDARTHSYGGGAVAIPGLVSAGAFTPAPTDAAALASVVDAVFRGVSAITPAVAAAGATPTQAEFNELVVLFNALLTVVRASYPTTPPTPSTASCASSVLKVSS